MGFIHLDNKNIGLVNNSWTDQAYRPNHSFI